MPANYDVLVTVYQELGMSDFAQNMAPRLLNYAQQNDWLGRQILDLGCGTGNGMEWLAQHGYIMTGIDQSAAMLSVAHQKFDKSGLNVRLERQDMRQLERITSMDLALSLDSLCELDNLKDLEAVFKSVHEALKPNKWFIFDMYTIQGLLERNQPTERIIYQDEHSLIITHNDFDYEKQTQTRRFIIFRQQGQLWQRTEATRTLRAYPILAITGLLQRYGFSIQTVLNPDLSRYELEQSRSARVIFVTHKRA